MIRLIRGSWGHHMRQSFVSRTARTPGRRSTHLDERLAASKSAYRYQVVVGQLRPGRP